MLSKKTIALSIAIAFLLLPLTSMPAAEKGQQKAAKPHNGAKLIALLTKRSARIGQNKERLQACMEKHPKMPANIKNDVQTLIGDLNAKQATIGQMVIDATNRNKAAVQADRATLKTQRATTKADWATLKADRQANKAARPAHAGKGQGQAEGQGQRQGKHKQ